MKGDRSISMVISTAVIERMDEIAKERAEGSRVEIFRRALALYDHCVELEKQGNVLASYSKECAVSAAVVPIQWH